LLVSCIPERRGKMKKGLYTEITLVMLISLSVLAAATSAFAWNQSFHAHVAKKCLGLDYRYIASYNARMGSLVPDFFWYLRDAGHINDNGTESYVLHGTTEEPCASFGTTYFYDTASGLIGFWNYRLRYFTKGIRAHVYADIVAHNLSNGFLDGPNGWVQSLHTRTGVTDLAALHLALELAVDSFFISKYGLHLNDLLFAYNQANFVEKVVVQAFNDSGWVLPENLDISVEFKKYLALMRALEKLAALYAPYLIQGEVPDGALSMLLESELLELEPELSEEGLNMYLRVLLILLVYPAEIRDTITGATGGMDWEDALDNAIDFCTDPVICD
jgi:hypothetical protein